MARPLDHAKRTELLTAVVRYIAEHGLADLSLRPLAAELGTSSRMLIYYFDTKENLLVQALTTQRPDIAAVFADITDAEALRERLWEFWLANTSGDGATSARAMTQVIGAACAPHGPYAGYANDAIAVFVSAIADGLRTIDTIDDQEAVATLLISGLRGILQDRLITGDVDRTDRAARRLIDQTVR
ncbi:TetR/AcrR family transcriptional regulator [Nocardia cyriacigeorgica]|uniref:TetR/AcrR family transcriptional regulator n=1 Tax=Nocardia cyriacigeorgica TaxID=135487 RepID=A0A6P1D2E9_9NOCA|nr:TetR/AcrR family transcriptional regulator [Nocardia cyriacigeorgica]NEW39647.1 TetR/AcrR family transcriptional regulator [Nocardia cyriacigeorgica]NEW44706.1 TetR/AcrR family transcriptional regulator [Nocardia cyriacigeorgica]NEW50137.1 TetR/AcrR family transcriptional regulator [Nocardia cyriacigeorgica]NEW57217.1 TetR/AcrR family transcriptional regulator [Nocardia cyriacigeorgica]